MESPLTRQKCTFKRQLESPHSAVRGTILSLFAHINTQTKKHPPFVFHRNTQEKKLE